MTTLGNRAKAANPPQGPVTRHSKVAGVVLLPVGLGLTAIGGYAVADPFGAQAQSSRWIGQLFGSIVLVIGLPALLGGIGILRGATWGRGIGILYSVIASLASIAWTIANITGPVTLAPSSAPPAAAASGSGVFAVAGVAPTVDDTGAPSHYVTSFGTTPCYPCQALFYVTYKLAPGFAGKVSTVTTSPDGKTTADSHDDPGSPRWGYFGISHMKFGYTDGFPLGDYKAVLTFEPTGESITLHFAITAAPTPAPTATVVQHILSTLLVGLTFVVLYAYAAIALIARWRRAASV